MELSEISSTNSETNPKNNWLRRRIRHARHKAARIGQRVSTDIDNIKYALTRPDQGFDPNLPIDKIEQTPAQSDLIKIADTKFPDAEVEAISPKQVEETNNDSLNQPEATPVISSDQMSEIPSNPSNIQELGTYSTKQDNQTHFPIPNNGSNLDIPMTFSAPGAPKVKPVVNINAAYDAAKDGRMFGSTPVSFAPQLATEAVNAATPEVTAQTEETVNNSPIIESNPQVAKPPDQPNPLSEPAAAPESPAPTPKTPEEAPKGTPKPEDQEAEKQRNSFWRSVTLKIPIPNINPSALRSAAAKMTRRWGLGMIFSAAAETAVHAAALPLHASGQAFLVGSASAGAYNLYDQIRRNKPKVDAKLSSEADTRFKTWYDGVADKVFRKEIEKAGTKDEEEIKQKIQEKIDKFNDRETSPAEQERMIKAALTATFLEKSVGGTPEEYARTMDSLPDVMIQKLIADLDINSEKKKQEKLKQFRATMRQKLADHAKSINKKELVVKALIGGAVGFGVHQALDAFYPSEEVLPEPSDEQVIPLGPETSSPLLNDLPTVPRDFSTVGPSNESFASFDGWAKGEVIKGLREMAAQDPTILQKFDPQVQDLITHNSGFDMNNPYDVDLANRLPNLPQFQQIFDQGSNTRHELIEFVTDKNARFSDRITPVGSDLHFVIGKDLYYSLPNIKALIGRILTS